MKAIILAAGLGSRFKHVTKSIHKALLPLPNGIPNIEQTIQYLIEASITDIYIITGHLSEQFEYLKDKYKCNLIHNPNYKKYNNIYSFKCASDYLANSYVIDSDVTLFKNIFKEKLYRSHYFLIERPKTNNKEWIPVIENNRIKEIQINNSEQPSLLGISFWNERDANIIKNNLVHYLSEKTLTDSALYWDNIPMNLLDKLDVGAKILSVFDAYEIDNLEEYNFILNLQKKSD